MTQPATGKTPQTFLLNVEGQQAPLNIAYDYSPHTHATERDKPAVLFLHGLHSDRLGGKIEAGYQWCRENHVDAASFDYPCHGQSDGDFVTFTISQAVAAGLHMIDDILKKPVILVGSSTGGWVALLLARARPEQVKGFVTVANACDFTEDLYWTPLPDAEKKQWEKLGYKAEPSWDGGEWRIGFDLIKDGRQHLLFGKHLGSIKCHARLLHGTADEAVPWQTSVRVAEELGGNNVEVRLVPHADHRFSTFENLATLQNAIAEMVNASQ